MNTVSIIGLGLIGGSFGLALRKAGFRGEILGVSEPRYVETAISMGAVSAAVTLEEASERSDLIYLSQTVEGILKTLEVIGPRVGERCLVTDVGSTKRTITQQARNYVRHAQFLGGHPMAGKETRGIQAAEAELFEGRPYVLTREGAESALEQEFRSWLKRMGAAVLVMSAEEHDRAVAFTSHLPQLLSTGLAETLAQQENAHFSAVFGPGLLDMTRLAMSAPEIWQSIVETNADEIEGAIAAFEQTLAKLKHSVRNANVQVSFTQAAGFARSLRSDFTKIKP